MWNHKTVKHEKINILFFLNSLVRGGVEHHVLDLLSNLNREKYNIIVVLPPSLRHQLNDELHQLALRVEEIEIRSWLHVKEIIRFIKLLRVEKIDIVHAHLYYASRFCSPIAWFSGVPVILETAHIEEHWRVGWKKLLVFIDSVSSLFTNRIIAVSHAVKNYYVNAKKIRADKITVVHNGVDFTRLEPEESDKQFISDVKSRFGINDESKIILVVGRLHSQKGHKFLIESANRIISRFPTCRFFFAGDGELKDELVVQVERSGTQSNFVFAGFIENVRALYSMADVVVLPSLYEGLPLTAIEASFMSCPIVATSVSGTPEIIINESTGLIVPPMNSILLANAVLRILEDQQNARKLAVKAHEFVLKNFSIQKQVKETEYIYDKCFSKIQC